MELRPRNRAEQAAFFPALTSMSNRNLQEQGTDNHCKTTEFSYYDIPAKLSPELVNLILVHLDTRSLATIRTACTSRFEYETGNVAQTEHRHYEKDPSYLRACYEATVEKYPSIFYEEAIKCQFPLVAEIFTRAPATWSLCPDHSLWGSMTSQRAFEFYEFWDARTELGVRAIQRGLPLMRQTNLIRFYLLHLWFWYGTSERCPPECRAQEGWNYFASLSIQKQRGIINFFDNLGCCLRDQFPVRYPFYSTSVLHSCRNQCAFCSRRLQNSKKSPETIQWRIPNYIPTELDNLGVADLVAKQLAIGKLSQLYELLNTKKLRPLDLSEEEYIQNFFNRFSANGRFWFWHPEHGPPLVKSGSGFVMRVDWLSYEIWVHGSRGNGRIEMRMPNRRPPSNDWSRLFEDAMAWQHVSGRPLSVGEWMLNNSAGPSYVFDRRRYWCWTEWNLCEDEDIGLASVLYVDAPW